MLALQVSFWTPLKWRHQLPIWSLSVGGSFILSSAGISGGQLAHSSSDFTLSTACPHAFLDILQSRFIRPLCAPGSIPVCAGAMTTGQRHSDIHVILNCDASELLKFVPLSAIAWISHGSSPSMHA